MGWRTTTVGELVALQRGYDLTATQREPGDVPVQGSAGQNGWHNVSKAQGPGVTVGRSGASIGRVFYVDQDYWPHNTTMFVTDFKGNDPRFIAHLLGSINLASRNSGSAQPSLNRNFLYSIETCAPDVADQRRIAGILSAYDDLIAVNERRIAVLEEMARRVFERKNAGLAVSRVPLGDLAQMRSGTVNPLAHADEVFDHYSYPAFDAGGLPSAEAGETIKSNKLTFDGRCILLGKLNPRIPRMWIVDAIGPRRAICSTEFMPLSPSDGAGFGWLAAAIQSIDFKEMLTGLTGGTSTSHQRAKPKDVMELTLATPSADDRRMMSTLLDPMFDLSAVLLRQNANLRTTRDLLLPRLVSGEIDVSEAPAFAIAAE